MRAPRALPRHSHARLRCRGHRREGLGPAASKARTLLCRGTKRAHSRVARTLQHLPRCSGRRVQCLGGEGLLEEKMAAHSSPLAWRSHGRRSPAGCSPRGREEADTPERLHLTSPRGPSPFHEALGTRPPGCGMRLGLRHEAAHVSCVSCWTQPLLGAVMGTPHPHRAAGAHTPSPCDRGALCSLRDVIAAPLRDAIAAPLSDVIAAPCVTSALLPA